MLTALAAVALCVVMTACSWTEEDAPPTATPDDFFTIVTRQPGEGEPISVYVVKEGDTLSAIAEYVDVSEQDLIDLNDLDDPNAIFVGQELLVPTPSPVTD